MTLNNGVQVFETDLIIDEVFERAGDEFYFHVDEVSSPLYDDIKAYLKDQNLINDAKGFDQWNKISDLVCDYADCRERLVFEYGFKAAVKLLFDCGIQGSVDLMQESEAGC